MADRSGNKPSSSKKPPPKNGRKKGARDDAPDPKGAVEEAHGGASSKAGEFGKSHRSADEDDD